MTKVSCDIIQDMLPLYCDDVCSADSRKMIEEHLPECEVCSNILHQLKSEYTVSVKEREENKEDSAVLGKMAHSFKIFPDRYINRNDCAFSCLWNVLCTI